MCSRVTSQCWCSYITFPLSLIVTQVPSPSTIISNRDWLSFLFIDDGTHDHRSAPSYIVYAKFPYEVILLFFIGSSFGADGVEVQQIHCVSRGEEIPYQVAAEGPIESELFHPASLHEVNLVNRFPMGKHTPDQQEQAKREFLGEGRC